MKWTLKSHKINSILLIYIIRGLLGYLPIKKENTNSLESVFSIHSLTIRE